MASPSRTRHPYPAFLAATVTPGRIAALTGTFGQAAAAGTTLASSLGFQSCLTGWTGETGTAAQHQRDQPDGAGRRRHDRHHPAAQHRLGPPGLPATAGQQPVGHWANSGEKQFNLAFVLASANGSPFCCWSFATARAHSAWDSRTAARTSRASRSPADVLRRVTIPGIRPDRDLCPLFLRDRLLTVDFLFLRTVREQLVSAT
jgi:hypothetical protein